MMDEYLWGQATRISPESPVMVVEVKSESQVPGGAANVVNNILALGGRVSVIGVVGEDTAGEQLISSLSSRKADIHGVLRDSSRPTTRKTRILAHHQQVLRVDREERGNLSPEMEEILIGRVRQLLPHSDAVILSDYAKGVLTRTVIRACIETAKELNLQIIANPKPQSARFMHGMTVISLNQSEAEMTAALNGIRENPLLFEGERLDEAGRILVKELGVENLLVTRGGKGLSLWT
jgi:D-beta-D-heptose 7-phosphate kinase/D-beta-D-heptose 1-phosphate adenosyltransferase